MEPLGEWLLEQLDAWTLGIFLLSTLACAGAVGAFLALGAREQTFEEAVEEQRKRRQRAEGGKREQQPQADRVKKIKKKAVVAATSKSSTTALEDTQQRSQPQAKVNRACTLCKKFLW